ncbi:MAG: ribonuclease III [Candidatus Kerfeldbacteria bacterium]|nr:ribonuclease III [Candidatus Kerfeldbacteria bacterium]
MRKSFAPLLKKLGLTFQDQDLLTQAFVHRSYINENPRFPLGHNERLEFLGDAVLELVVTEYLYKTYQNPEGELTNWRSSLVNARTLADVAESLDFDSYLLLSRGEAKDQQSKARQSILANTYEAFVGALYLDQGFAACEQFIGRTIVPLLPAILEQKLYRDPKSQLQEESQERLNVTPTYQVMSETGPDHAKHFRVAVFFGRDEVARGEGSSKQEAQVAAAQAALDKRGW